MQIPNFHQPPAVCSSSPQRMCHSPIQTAVCRSLKRSSRFDRRLNDGRFSCLYGKRTRPSVAQILSSYSEPSWRLSKFLSYHLHSLSLAHIVFWHVVIRLLDRNDRSRRSDIRGQQDEARDRDTTQEQSSRVGRQFTQCDQVMLWRWTGFSTYRLPCSRDALSVDIMNYHEVKRTSINDSRFLRRDLSLKQSVLNGSHTVGSNQAIRTKSAR
ncbi:hypothetical protein BDZ89DRAFT_759794 [Hymenopellis radicata]|nr:hypothetical protein BDZ89DRAFT_759794 [Hymenopellis radicata]